MLKLRHAFLGELTRYVCPRGLSCDFKTLGFEDVYRVKDPDRVLIFNRQSGVYYEGSENNNSNLNRVSILLGISGNANSATFTWGNEKWSKEKIEKIFGFDCSYFETQIKEERWQIWISKEIKLPNKIYHMVSEWVRLPNLGGLPVRAVRTNRFGDKTVVLECTGIKMIPAPANYLQVPPGLKRVSNIAEVCSLKNSFMQDVLDTLK